MPALPRLRSLRQAAALSIEDLALKAHVSDVTISHIENGRVEPRPSTVRRLARALKVPPQELTQSETGEGK
jgi:transcriptional regulator with XRE-family HTH domain